MRRITKSIKNIVTMMMSISLSLSGFCMSSAAEQMASFKVDGVISEWENVEKQSSNDERIEKWAVAQDDETYYFYVQQNGGNQYGLPITNTKMEITYADGSNGRNNLIQFAGMMDALKDGWYGDISSVETAYEMSEEANKYEIEFSVPKSFFENKEFTLTYCGAKIDSKDIVETKNVLLPEVKEPVYDGITIDGNFKDWNAIAKTKVEDEEHLTDVAMIFDGDYIYIYMKETSDKALVSSGDYKNGAFTIHTDLGRDTVFKLNTDSIENVEGATVSHSNLQYEIAIPVSEIKQYKETISFGYFMDQKLLIENVANLQADQDRDTSFDTIVYDGSYLDWEYYPHQLVQYSSPGTPVSDAEAALYQKDSLLYGHVKTYLNLNSAEFKDITLSFNDEQSINLTLVGADEDGNIIRNPQLRNLSKGTYEYYLWDRDSGSSAKNIKDEDAPLYGKIMVTIGASSDEMEYYVELDKVAEHLSMDVTDMKLIQAQYINIGKEWVTIGGASSGPIVGILISIAIAALSGVLLERKSQKQNKVEQK